MKKSGLVVAYSLCVFGFLFSLFWFYPGYLSYDSVMQLHQALSFHFRDVHPPVMAWLWHYLLFISPFKSDAAVMFILQLALLWSGLALWVYVLSKRVKGYLWLLPLIGLLPNLMILNGFIWKDIQMGNSLLLMFALSILLKDGLRHQLLKWVLVILFVLVTFYAFALRYEAPLVCMPLFYVWAGWLLPKSRWFFKAGLVVLAVVVFAALNFGLERALHTQRDYAAQQTMIYDLANLSIKENKMLIPLAYCTSPPNSCFDVIKKKFYPSSIMSIVNTSGVPVQWGPHYDQYQMLKQAWLENIAAHPFWYVQGRMIFFADTLGNYTDFFEDVRNIIFFKPQTFFVTLNAFSYTAYVVYTSLLAGLAFCFVVGFWLALEVVSLFLLRKAKADDAFVINLKAMLLSGLILCLCHSVLAASDDFRYSYWMMLASAVAFVMVVLIRDNKPDAKVQTTVDLPQ